MSRPFCDIHLLMKQGSGSPDPHPLMAALRKERRLREMPLTEIADRVGVTHQAIQQFETGAKRPTKQTLRKWLRALEMPLERAEEWEDDLRAGAVGREVLGRTGSEADAEAVERVVRGILADARRRK